MWDLVAYPLAPPTRAPEPVGTPQWEAMALLTQAGGAGAGWGGRSPWPWVVALQVTMKFHSSAGSQAGHEGFPSSKAHELDLWQS